jgi:hypothetical protein
MKIIIYFLLIMTAIHIYLHFVIHPENYLSILKDITREEITNTVYYKLPFIINGNDIVQPIQLKECIKIDKGTYTKTYEPISFIEPFVKFFTNDYVYKLKKNKFLPKHFNLECRNFYIVHKGIVKVHVIHPKYKDVLTDNIENHSKILQITLTEKEMIFVPNYWGVYIKALDDAIIEKVQYKTILNHANFLWDYVNNINITKLL